MTDEIPSLGELELRVLRLVWENEPCSERTVTDLLQAERSVARTTVLKTLQRLEGKELLERVPGTVPVQFRAVVKEKQVIPTLVERFVDRVLGGATGPLMAYLAESETLSAKDAAALRKLAAKLGEASEQR